MKEDSRRKFPIEISVITVTVNEFSGTRYDFIVYLLKCVGRRSEYLKDGGEIGISYRILVLQYYFYRKYIKARK